MKKKVVAEALRMIVLLIALALVACMQVGCAGFDKKLKSFLGGKDSGDLTSQQEERPKSSTPRFSDQENYSAGMNRQYKRMNRQKLEEESDLSANAGSLWVMEGQKPYLFAQNTARQIGDYLNVKIEGNPKQQLQSKAKVIQKLLEKLDRDSFFRAPSSAPAQNTAGNQNANAQAQAPAGAPTQAGPAGANANAQANNQQAPTPGAQADNKTDAPFAVQDVPTRVVETLKDGSYRVKGNQTFMIGKKEYKVIVTGVVKPEDFNDEGISASKLLDAQYDIVSTRKAATL